MTAKDLDAARLLDDLNDAQREAVLATTGPVVILAGAGTGKTRVISRRAAYAIATGRRAADEVLVVTFTDKAAGEMVERLRGLGQPGVTARTFHAHALSQLRHFWPSRHDGEPMPEILDSKIPIVGRLARGAARRLPVHRGEGPRRRDRVGEEPAASTPGDVRRGAGRAGGDRDAADPGRAVRPAVRRLRTGQDSGPGRIDFDDMLDRDRRAARDGRRGARPRPSRPASAGSASTSTRTRTRSRSGCSSCGSASGRDLCVVGRRGPDDLHVHRRDERTS